MNDYGKMERPEDRQAEDLIRSSSTGNAKKTKGSVSMSTFQNTGRLITAIVWLAFLAGVGYGTYVLLQTFMAG